MIEITSALTGIKATLELARAALGARDDAKVQAALLELQGKLFDLSTASLALSEKNMALHQQLTEAQEANRQLQAEAQERDRYTLAEVRPGLHAYTSGDMQTGYDAAAHYLCQPCYDSGKKVVLQHRPRSDGTYESMFCPETDRHRLVFRP